MIALDLFSGYGGITEALKGHSTPILYCEKEKYAQGILISRMEDGSLPFAPIWNDVTTLDGTKFRHLVEFIYGGFPCQDISVAGKGKGLEGQRSGLFYQVARLCEEISPVFVFLENVPAIRTRGSIEIQETMARLGYDCRWGVISAAEVGANHKRERWFMLAIKRDYLSHAHSNGLWNFGKWGQVGETEANDISGNHGTAESMAHPMFQGSQRFWCPSGISPEVSESGELGPEMANANLSGLSGEANAATEEKPQWWAMSGAVDSSFWEIEPPLGRVANGTPLRAHRIKALGNGVVPLQVRTAFETLLYHGDWSLL